MSEALVSSSTTVARHAAATRGSESPFPGDWAPATSDKEVPVLDHKQLLPCVMTSVFRTPLACMTPCAAGRGSLQPNYPNITRHEAAQSERIVRLRSCSGECFGNVSQMQSRLAENCEASNCPKRKSLLRYRRISGRFGVCSGSFAKRKMVYKSAHCVHEIFYRLETDVPTFSPRRTCIICRVQSVEGTEKSHGPDTHREQKKEQKKLELFTERLEGTGETGETPEVRLQESELLDTSTGNAEQDDSVWSGEKKNRESDGKEHSGNPRNNGTSIGSDDEPNGISNDVETEMVPSEELHDYGSGTDWEDELESYVTRISVPRQRYIPVPKVDLVNSLLMIAFPANKDASEFFSICSHLEIILHAEHKVLLEELRSDYSITHSVDTHGSKLRKTTGATNSTKLGTASTEREQKHATIGEQGDWPIDSRDVENRGVKQQLFKVLTNLRAKFKILLDRQRRKHSDREDNVEEGSPGPSSNVQVSDAAAERFQKNFVRLLRRAEFEGISLRDLELTAALNSDYLLSTPVDVDWKRTSSSNVKIYRRGYTKETQKGLLLGEKLDYLQSLILRQAFKGFARPLLYAGRWCIQKWNSLWNDKESRELAESVSGWLKEPLQLTSEEPLNGTGRPTDYEAIKYDREVQLNMPIWLAARQAIPRYEAILSSAGSRGLLIRRILMRMGLLQSESPSQTLPITDESECVFEPHLRPNLLSRVSMKDIWLPASQAVVGRNPFKMISAAFSVFFSRATLQEPAFKELVLLYNTGDDEDSIEAGLQLQTYKGIPLPDLKIVFPSKKLMFRVLDTLKLDITSIIGLLAFTVNYRFDDFLSSPSAFVLDIIAASALVVFITRVSFGYKTVWDRYQLLVNKTLYEKTGARGFGVVQFLVDESEEQQFKEAILVFTVLVRQGKAKGMTTKQITDACERILYYRCKAQVEMPVTSAVSTLLKFGLIVRIEEMSADNSHDAKVRFRAVSYEEGLRALEQHWISMPSTMSLWN